MVHKKSQRDSIDDWLLGYQSFTPSVAHKAVWAGERMGMRSPTLDEYRLMQGAALASDIGAAGLLYAVAVEGTPWQVSGTSRALTRFQLYRIGRYARFTPAGIAATFVFIAATNWERPTRTYTEYQPFGPSGPTQRRLTLS